MNARPRIALAGPNLSLDRTIRVERAALGKVHRSIASDTRGGGKGVNVARALKCMGREAVVAGLAGGRTGQAVVGLLADEGLSLVAVEAPGETRSCLSVLSDGSLTVFNESGPDIDSATWTRFEHAVLETLEESLVFVFSGSLPPGTPEDAAARLVSAARARGCTTICDTSHVYLKSALAAEPDIIKPNLAEALAVLEGKGDEAIDAGANALERAREACLELLTLGPRSVVVSAGAAGAAYATPRRSSYHRLARGRGRQPRGSGGRPRGRTCAGARAGRKSARSGSDRHRAGSGEL